MYNQSLDKNRTERSSNPNTVHPVKDEIFG